MEIERWRRDCSLAQHHVNLSPMMRLVVEKMAHRDRGLLLVLAALIVGVAKRPGQKIGAQVLKEILNPSILLDAGGP